MGVSIEMFQPQMSEYRMSKDGLSLVLQTSDGSRNLELPLSAREFLEYFDGTHRVSDIISSMHAKEKRFRFRDLLQTLHKLINAGFIANASELEDKIDGRVETLKGRGWFWWPVFAQFRVVEQSRLSGESLGIFNIIAGLVTLLGIGSLFLLQEIRPGVATGEYWSMLELSNFFYGPGF